MLQQALDDADEGSSLRVKEHRSPWHIRSCTPTRFEKVRISPQQAVSDAERLDQPHLLSLALGMRVMLGFMAGEGFDDTSLHRALELEDPQAITPLVFRPTMQHALLLEFTGQLDTARAELDAIRLRCAENGEEGEYVFIAQHVVMSSIWRGHFAQRQPGRRRCRRTQPSAQRRHRFCPGAAACAHHWLCSPLGVRSSARLSQMDSSMGYRQTGTFRLGERLLGTLAFLEVSLGNYAEAVAAVAPLLSAFDLGVDTGPNCPVPRSCPTPSRPLVQLGRLAEAAPLIVDSRSLRTVGTFYWAWMSRGRRARPKHDAWQRWGDLDGAPRGAYSGRRPTTSGSRCRSTVPRTLLLFGQLERRMRKKELGVGQPGPPPSRFSSSTTRRCGPTGPVPNWRAPTLCRWLASRQLTPSEQRVALRSPPRRA